MKEAMFEMVATIAALAYVLTYAWAQMEILSSILGMWKARRRTVSAVCGIVWAAMNCFSFLVAHEVIFDVIRERRLVFFEIEKLWAKTLAVIVIAAYATWVAASLYLALRRSRRIRAAATEVPPP